MNLPPLSHLRHFAELLGWKSLAKHTHCVSERERREVNLPRTIAWYESGEFDDLLLQINVMPTLRAAVYAPRYRLCSLWHSFDLGSTSTARRAEAERLNGWLHRRRFERPASRSAYRRLHPECCGFSARRIRERRVADYDGGRAVPQPR